MHRDQPFAFNKIFISYKLFNQFPLDTHSVCFQYFAL